MEKPVDSAILFLIEITFSSRKAINSGVVLCFVLVKNFSCECIAQSAWFTITIRRSFLSIFFNLPVSSVKVVPISLDEPSIISTTRSINGDEEPSALVFFTWRSLKIWFSYFLSALGLSPRPGVSQRMISLFNLYGLMSVVSGSTPFPTRLTVAVIMEFSVEDLPTPVAPIKRISRCFLPVQHCR